MVHGSLEDDSLIVGYSRSITMVKLACRQGFLDQHEYTIIADCSLAMAGPLPWPHWQAGKDSWTSTIRVGVWLLATKTEELSKYKNVTYGRNHKE